MACTVVVVETVNLLASDPDSPNGLATFYSIDGANFVQGNSFPLIDGNHTVQFYSVDVSGNREATHTQAFNIDSTAPVVTATASPNSLFPPNHKLVAVTVSGHVSDASGGVPGVVSYRITDEYNPSHPITGTALVDASGNYAFIVPLQASRQGQDKNGRQYTIVVAATDQAGNTGSATTFVVVPHDQGNHSGGGNNGNGNHGHENHGHGNHGHGNHGHGNHGHGHDGGTGAASGGSSGGVNQGNGGDNGNHGHGNGNHGHA